MPMPAPAEDTHISFIQEDLYLTRHGHPVQPIRVKSLSGICFL